jgi:hypothetical protein
MARSKGWVLRSAGDPRRLTVVPVGRNHTCMRRAVPPARYGGGAAGVAGAASCHRGVKPCVVRRAGWGGVVLHQGSWPSSYVHNARRGVHAWVGSTGGVHRTGACGTARGTLDGDERPRREGLLDDGAYAASSSGPIALQPRAGHHPTSEGIAMGIRSLVGLAVFGLAVAAAAAAGRGEGAGALPRRGAMRERTGRFSSATPAQLCDPLRRPPAPQGAALRRTSTPSRWVAGRKRRDARQSGDAR